MGPCDRIKERVCAEKRKGVFFIKGEKRRSTSICGESTVKRVYSTIKIATDFTSTICRKEKWQEKDGARLLPC